MSELLLFPEEEHGPIDRLAEARKKYAHILPQLEHTIFYYKLKGEADKVAFKKVIMEWVKDDVYHDFKKVMNSAIWLANNKGQTINYMYFNERSHRLYIDNKMWEWCNIIRELMELEWERVEKAV